MTDTERLKKALCLLTDLYDEPGFLLVNYTVRRKLRDILGRNLSNQILDREPARRLTMRDLLDFSLRRSPPCHLPCRPKKK